jgi:uncharacterized membrane protein YeaQ/YmgE (transglycosylase-associated protein family)
MPDASSLLYVILTGLAAGVAASIVFPTGISLIGATVVGIIGAAIGFWLSPALGAHVTHNPTIATILTSTAGASLWLFVHRLARL